MNLVKLAHVYQSIHKAESFEEVKRVTRYALESAMPNHMFRTGQMQGVPPSLHTTEEITLILCNHQSDADQWLVASQFDHKPNKITAFTHADFESLPVIGKHVRTQLIGLYKGDTEARIQQRIQSFLEQGYNTFILFPEGTFLQSRTLQASRDFVATLDQPDGKHREPFTRVLYPRHGAMQAFVNLVQDRLKYVVDVTLQYPGYDPTETGVAFNYLKYPSMLSFAMMKEDSRHDPAFYPIMHTQVYELRGKGSTDWQRMAQPEWLISLWAKKNKRLKERFEFYHTRQHLQPSKK